MRALLLGFFYSNCDWSFQLEIHSQAWKHRVTVISPIFVVINFHFKFPLFTMDYPICHNNTHSFEYDLNTNTYFCRNIHYWVSNKKITTQEETARKNSYKIQSKFTKNNCWSQMKQQSQLCLREMESIIISKVHFHNRQHD